MVSKWFYCACRIGNERWVDALPWTNSSAFVAAKEHIWDVNGTDAGSVRSAAGLSFVKIDKAVSCSKPYPKPPLARAAVLQKVSTSSQA